MIRSDWLDISIKHNAGNGVWAELAAFLGTFFSLHHLHHHISIVAKLR